MNSPRKSFFFGGRGISSGRGLLAFVDRFPSMFWFSAVFVFVCFRCDEFDVQVFGVSSRCGFLTCS